MEIKQIREMLGTTRPEFSRKYGIPVRTLENWESGKSKCPDYVMALLERVAKEDALEIEYGMKFEHYGVSVTHCLIAGEFEDELKEKGIQYTALPLVGDNVLKYEWKGQIKYAYITEANAADEAMENVYVTTKIPEDMNWSNIELDYMGQKANEAPMLLPSRARVLYDTAKKMAQEKETPSSFSEWMSPVSKKELKLALNALGVTIDDLKVMDHYDVSEEELED